MAIFPYFFLKWMDVQQAPKFSLGSANIYHTMSRFVMRVKGPTDTGTVVLSVTR